MTKMITVHALIKVYTICTVAVLYGVNAEKRYPVWPFEFTWSYIGDLQVKGYNCTSFNEPMQPWNHFWYDNYLCFHDGEDIIDPELNWSTAGPIADMRCTKIWEPADTEDFHDNYLCVPKKTPYNFRFAYDGCIRKLDCISVNEPGDPNAWWDNYICNERTGFHNKTYEHFCFGYSATASVNTTSILLVLIAAVCSAIFLL